MHEPWALAKRLVPRALKDRMREAARPHALAWAARRLRRRPVDRAVRLRHLECLRFGWGNPGFTAPVPFLERVAASARNTGGPILECGSGCSTLLLGLVAASRGVPVWSLEHDARWHETIADSLRRHSISGVHLLHAPLQSYGDFAWYAPPALTALPGRFTLVVCDGPPGTTTPGGRYGLLPVLGDRLGPGAEILLDDASREEERAVLARWASERPFRAVVDEGAGRGIAHLTLG